MNDLKKIAISGSITYWLVKNSVFIFTFLGNLINHKTGYVCPLGVILGKIMLILCILQIYVLYNEKYKNYKCIHALLLFIGIVISFMNYRLQQNILSAFILQLLIILLPN